MGNKLKPKYYFAIIIAVALHGQAFATLDDDLVGKNWGCTVKFCKMNPKGEMDEPKCRPAIRKFHEEMAKKHPHPPKCEDQSENKGDESGVRKVYDYYYPCPAGMTVAQDGTLVAPGVRSADSMANITGMANVTAEPKISKSAWNAESTAGERACVGTPVGMIKVSVGQAEQGETMMMMIYSSVIWQTPQPKPTAVELYSADGKFLRRERLN